MNIPQAKRATDLKDFPEEFESSSSDMEWSQHVILGKSKRDGNLQQICSPRVSKFGVEGGLGNYSLEDVDKDFSEIHIYRIEEKLVFKKMPDLCMKQILSAEKAFNIKE